MAHGPVRGGRVSDGVSARPAGGRGVVGPRGLRRRADLHQVALVSAIRRRGVIPKCGTLVRVVAGALPVAAGRIGNRRGAASRCDRSTVPIRSGRSVPFRTGMLGRVWGWRGGGMKPCVTSRCCRMSRLPLLDQSKVCHDTRAKLRCAIAPYLAAVVLAALRVVGPDGSQRSLWKLAGRQSPKPTDIAVKLRSVKPRIEVTVVDHY